MTIRLALHTWTLDTTPLAGALSAVKRAGWDGVELRRVDFERAAEGGQSAEQVIALARASGLAVACVGVELGWMFAENGERKRLLDVFAESCRWAEALGCSTVMSPVDRGHGDVARAVDSVREVGDIAAKHGRRLALEFNSQAEQINTLEACLDIVTRAGHPGCGLLLDTYHMRRSGTDLRAILALAPSDIAYVQFSDVPAQGLVPGMALDRLPPGAGTVDFRAIWTALAAKGYTGYVSYEAPNPAAWARPADEVAREALSASRAIESA